MRIPERPSRLTRRSRPSAIRRDRPCSGTIGGVFPTSPRGAGRDPGPDDSSRTGWPRERSTVRRPRRDEPDYGSPGANTDPYGWSGLRDEVRYPPTEGRDSPTGELRLDGLAPDRPASSGPAKSSPATSSPATSSPATSSPGISNGRPQGEAADAGRPGNRARARLRRPHKRRAVAGQQTGLDPELQSELPSWLRERGEALA